jgi:hypothetical protein
MTTLLHILQHSLGRDEFGIPKSADGTDYRNYYSAGPGHHSLDMCRHAVAEDLMTEHPQNDARNTIVFCVTAKGIEYIEANSPEPPKLTSGQRRYQEYMDLDTDEPFGEWLKRRSKA